MNLIDEVIYRFDLFGIIPHTMPNAIGLWPNEQECLVWGASQCATTEDWLEIGSFCGGSTLLLALTQKLMGSYKQVVAVDKKFNTIFDYNVENSGLDNIRKFELVSTNLLFEYYEPISFAFIDGYHSFKAVLSDFQIVDELLNDDGIIMFHDVSPRMYTHDKDYINETYAYARKHWLKLTKDNTENFRIDEAIAVICKNSDYKIIDIPVRNKDTYFEETGLTEWKRGKTSPYNAITAIRKT